MKPGAFGKYAVDYEIRVDYDRLRKERLQRAKDQINKDGLGAIVTWDEANIRYLTSYYVTTPMRASEIQFVFLAKNGEPYLFGGGTPSETERRMPWMHGRVHPAIGAPRLTANNADDFAIAMIVETIGKLMAEHGVEKETLGIDGSTLQMLYGEAFGKKGITAVHGKPTMDEARMIKTRDEIELMRITCANSEKAFAAIADAIRPGVRECDLVGIGIKALYEEGDDHTEDLVCCSGYNTNPYGWSFSDKPIRPGDLIYIDVDGASYQGYKSCVYRTFCCGKATQEQKDLYEECRAMLYDAIDVVKEGATTHEVADQWPDSPSYWGYENMNEVLPYAIGHGIGLTLHDRPVISMLQKAAGYPPVPLKAGMAIALETYAGKKGGEHGVRLEENILVTEEGCEVLTRWPIEELMECWLPYR
jgi:Xaa-Pro dipeptidase